MSVIGYQMSVGAYHRYPPAEGKSYLSSMADQEFQWEG